MKIGWIAVLFIFLSITAQGKERIVWILPDWPAMEQTSGKPADGIFQRIAKDITAEMPSYDHRFVVGNIDKVVRLLKEHKNICALPALVTPFRQELATFTALTVVPSFRFVVLSGKASSFQLSKGQVSMRSVLENKNIKGALIQERSYGTLLDRLVTEKKRAGLIWVQPKEDWMTVLSMVRNGRVDYTLELTEVVRHSNLKNPTESSLVALSMVEVPPTLPVFVACTKGEWGRKIILNIDRVLQKLSGTEAFKKKLDLLFMNEPTPVYKQDMKEFIEKRMAGSWVY